LAGDLHHRVDHPSHPPISFQNGAIAKGEIALLDEAGAVDHQGEIFDERCLARICLIDNRPDVRPRFRPDLIEGFTHAVRLVAKNNTESIIEERGKFRPPNEGFWKTR